MIYLEGISLPISHKYIEKEDIKKEITNRTTGKKQIKIIHKIKGLKFDSKIIDMMLNRGLTDAFTKVHLDLPNLAILIGVMVGVIVGIVNIVMWFV